MTDMPPELDLLSSPQAADLLGVSPRTIHRLVADGQLTPAVIATGGQHGGFKFHRVDVQRIAQQRQAASATAEVAS